MNNELKPYGEYKKANLLWIDRVPIHWKVVSNKELWAERSTKNCIGEELLSVTIKKGIIRQKDLIKNSSKKDSSNVDKSNYKLVIQNDIAYNKMRMWQGAVGKSDYRGIVSPAYVVLKPRMEFNAKYFHYLLRTVDYIEESHRYSYGICDDQLNLRYEDFKRMKNILPTRKEQDQIVKYLEYQLTKINKFIKSKKKLVLVLKEQKQAVINEAVTKGINPNVKMKPSGIEWLGDIPEHWEVRYLKHFVKSNIEALTEKFDKENTIEYIDISSVGYGELRRNPVKYKFQDAPSRARRVVHYGDTIISTVRTYLKSMCFVDDSIKNCIVSTGFAVLTPNKFVYPRLLNYVLSSFSFVNRVSKYSIGVSYPAINESKLLSLKIALPNTIQEQKEILDYIAKKIITIDESIYKIQKKVNLITEYRTRLISDVITGKVDVRNIVIDENQIEDIEQTDDEIMDNEEDVNIGESEEQ